MQEDRPGPIGAAVGGAIKFLMVVAMAVLCVLVFLNVVLRYGFNSNLILTEEVARYIFVWMTFLGAILAFARSRHVNVDLVLRMLPNRPRLVVELLADAIILVCCYLIIRGCFELAALNTINHLPITGMPVSWLYIAGLPFGICIALLTLRNAVLRVRRASQEDVA